MEKGENKVHTVQPKRWWRHLLGSWKAGVLLLTPLLLLPLPLTHSDPTGRCAYVALLMAIFWITEALPMAITGLLPVLLFPLLGIMSSSALCKGYFKDVGFLLFGGMAIAFAIERWNLHKRMGLRVILTIGTEPKWLILSFMLTTGFLSMWMANTAVTAMMLPTALAVTEALRENRQLVRKAKASTSDENEFHAIKMKSSTDTDEEIEPLDSRYEDQKFESFAKGLALSVAYSANIGGTGSLTGTPPNMVMKGILDTLYGDDSSVTFGSWFVYSFPNMVLCEAITYLWIVLFFLGPRTLLCKVQRDNEDAKIARRVIQEEYDKLGSMSFAEVSVLGHFIVLVLLWITRQPKIVPGWAELFPPGFVSDGVVSVAIVICLFCWPAQKPTLAMASGKTFAETRLLDWYTVQEKMRWMIIFVIGGGFTLAKGCQETGVSAAVGKVLYNTGVLPTWLMVLILCAGIALMTEITSNTATATIFLPILAELATDLHLNPLYLIVPATVSTSFAFMLPVATGPNQLVFASGSVTSMDMIKAGSMLNLWCVLVVFISIHTWGFAIFQLGQFPSWALSVDGATAAQNATQNIILNVTEVYGL